MSTKTILLTLAKALVQAANELESDVTSPAPVESQAQEPAPAETKGKRGKKTATKEEVAETPVEAEESEDDDLFGDDTEKEPEGPTIEDVRKTVKDFATKHGKEKALKLLGKFKVTSIPDLKKDDWAKVIELAKKHL